MNLSLITTMTWCGNETNEHGIVGDVLLLVPKRNAANELLAEMSPSRRSEIARTKAVLDGKTAVTQS